MVNSTAMTGFLVFTILVAIISYVKSRKVALNSTDALFFANRSNGYLVVGGSLFLSNISANQFIGENESVYVNNMSVIGWGISSVLAMLLVSEFFLPVYLRYGISTIPEYLEQRYDKSTKHIVTVVFLVSYIINLLPPVLYGGAVALTGMFDIAGYLHVDYWQAIWVMVWVIGLTGATYSMLGGFKAISVSDTLLGLCMLIIAVIVPYFGLKHLGNGNVTNGIRQLLGSHKSHLNAIGKATDAVPFNTLFTGMLIVNVYYWGMEQYIIQQALAAKSLKDSQKGIALACLAKLLAPLLINLPGLIGVHLYRNLQNTAVIYPLLVKDTLPSVFTGLVASVVFGAAITTFNAGLNSSSTLFILDIYKPYRQHKQRNVSETHLVKVSRRFQFMISLFAMLFAPFILFAKNGFYTYLQTVNGLFSVPIFTIVLLGFIHRKISPIAAKIGIVFFMISYLLTQFVWHITLHYLHVISLLFLATATLMLIISKIFPPVDIAPLVSHNHVQLEPWKNRFYYSILLLILMIAVFLIFSPLGIA